MKVICIESFNTPRPLSQIPGDKLPKEGQIFNVTDGHDYCGEYYYAFTEYGPKYFFLAAAFRPLDFGDKVCEELEKEFSKQTEPELV